MGRIGVSEATMWKLMLEARHKRTRLSIMVGRGLLRVSVGARKDTGQR